MVALHQLASSWYCLRRGTALEASLLEVLAATSGRSMPQEEPAVLLANLTLRRTTVGVVAGASMPTQGTLLLKQKPAMHTLTPCMIVQCKVARVNMHTTT